MFFFLQMVTSNFGHDPGHGPCCPGPGSAPGTEYVYNLYVRYLDSKSSSLARVCVCFKSGTTKTFVTIDRTSRCRKFSNETFFLKVDVYLTVYTKKGDMFQ